MDIQTPVMDGYMATKKIRSLEDSDLANIPIIALSANAFEEDRKASTDAGMNGHLEKPVNVSELLKMLCSCFRRNLISAKYSRNILFGRYTFVEPQEIP